MTVSLAIVQRVCTGYRLELFRRLSARPELRVRLFIGEDLPGSKVRSTADFGEVDVVKLPTRWVRLGRRVQPIQKGIQKAFSDFGPDVILSEAESHFWGYMAAVLFRLRQRNPKVAVVQWGLGGLPGLDHSQRRINRLKVPLHSFADAFLVYSSYGRDVMVGFGHAPEDVIVAVNVSDTERHLAASRALDLTRAEARARLGLPERFTVLTVGAMDANKHPDVLVDAADGLDPERFNVLLVGGGGIVEQLRESARSRGLEHVVLTGAVDSTELATYYRAADVLAMPGRGGMVISEAMAHGLPVIVHLADGTEFDLVREGETGIRLARGRPEDFRAAIIELAADAERAAGYGAAGQRLVETELNMNAMVDRIVDVAHRALERRRHGRSAMPSS